MAGINAANMAHTCSGVHTPSGIPVAELMVLLRLPNGEMVQFLCAGSVTYKVLAS